MPAAQAETEDQLHIGRFSTMPVSASLPMGWQPHTFNNIESHTAYFLTRLNDMTVIKAVSHASASALYKDVRVNPKNYPYINWQWQVERVIDKGNVTSKEGDDYPARLYVSFEYDINQLTSSDRIKYKLYKLLYDKAPPLAVINYIWDNKTPTETIVSNAYSDRVKMIVIRSGKSQTGKWLKEKRNILVDYQKAFGEKPGNITGVAIMTDADNTRESATAWYGDIFFSKK